MEPIRDDFNLVVSPFNQIESWSWKIAVDCKRRRSILKLAIGRSLESDQAIGQKSDSLRSSLYLRSRLSDWRGLERILIKHKG